MSQMPVRAHRAPQLPEGHPALDSDAPTFERARHELEGALRAFADSGERGIERTLKGLHKRSQRAAAAFQETWGMLGLEIGFIGTPDDFAKVARVVLQRMKSEHDLWHADQRVQDARKAIETTLRTAVHSWTKSRVEGL